MAPHLLHRLLSTIENILKSLLSEYPKYPNKVQVSALIYFFKCFPTVPTAPVTWSSKKRCLVPLKNKYQTYLFLAWVFLFDFLIGVFSPCYLLWMESNSSKTDTNFVKMGMKTSTFQILFAVGTFCSVCYSIFSWIMDAKNICLDYKIVSNFANYLHYVDAREHPYRKLKRKPNVMGIMMHINNQGFVNSAYMAPPMSMYFKMDPMWYMFAGMFPSCVLENGDVLNDNYCYAIFYGIRPCLLCGWMMNSGRIMGGSILFAWIFFEMFNKCAEMLNGLKTEQGMHLYWAYWKAYIGTKYWFRASLATAIYGGIWLTTVCLYATLVILPSANPLTLVYFGFPFCGMVAVLAFMCLPYILKFPILSRELMNKWRYAAGIEKNSFKGKIMRREVRAMQPVVIEVGEFFKLEKSIAVVVITAVVDQTVNLIMSMNSI